MRPALLLSSGLLVIALAGCGTTGDPSAADPTSSPTSPSTPDPSTPAPSAPSGMPTSVPPAEGIVSTSGLVTILEKDDGPELCLGGELDSYPPQCGGPLVVGWTWADHRGSYTHRSGTKWGSFHVTGTFDGTSITPTSVIPAASYDAAAPPADPDPFTTPCPTPAGGWKPVDPDTTTRAALQATFDVADGLPDYAESWVDQSPKADNDPTELILNVAVTGDTSVAEQKLRETWGGALCVSQERHTDVELGRIQDELAQAPGMLSSSHGRDHVDVTVTYDDGSLQTWADAAYGPDVVRITSALTRVES